MEGITKRGNKYTIRHDKKTNGYSKVIADQQAKPGYKEFEKYFDFEYSCIEHEKVINKKVSNNMTRLAVRGTFDTLSQRLFLIKKTSIEHPIDKGYFKKVSVLAPFGVSKLKRLRENKLNKNKA